MPSEPMPDFAVSVKGPNFDEDMDLQKLLASYSRIGFQANSLGKAIDIVNKMVSSLFQVKNDVIELNFLAIMEVIR